NIFKIRAYRTAARSIEQLPEELAQMVASGKDLEDIPGVGPAIARKITELITTGHLRLYDELRSEAGSTENAR
ncbi:MAG: DNA polymerase III, partial [Chloroflexota bacterium]|nr:DNA polymerase III [Chloroflexota bacterium]